MKLCPSPTAYIFEVSAGTLLEHSKPFFLPGVETVLSYWLSVVVQSQHKYFM